VDVPSTASSRRHRDDRRPERARQDSITVNAISPGPIETDHADPAARQHAQAQLGRIPVGRLGQPEDIARLSAYLASDDGGFISGQMIAANGAATT
jgi:3-oxoacyl-[acyl-carrier protein] reductase